MDKKQTRALQASHSFTTTCQTGAQGSRLKKKSLTGLSDDDLVGECRAVLVVGRALVRPLVGLRLLAADVDDQSPRTGLHQDFGVLLQVKVGSVSRP